MGNILRWANVVSFEKTHLQEHQKAILEHNITVLSKIYLNISFKRIGKFLDIAPEQAESIIGEMVAEKRIKARLDHLSSSIEF